MNLVFLHGLAGDPEDFSGVAASLPGLRLSMPRLDYLHGEYACLESLADRIAQELPYSFRKEGFVAAGNSLGALLALCMGHVAERAVLIAPHVGTRFRFMGRGDKVFQRELARIFHDPHHLSPAQIARYHGKWRDATRNRKAFSRLRRLKAVIESFNPSPWFEQFQERLHMVCGRYDTLSPVEQLAGLKRSYPAMGFSVLPRCGHAVPLEQPARLARILSRLNQPPLAMHREQVYAARACERVQGDAARP